MENRDPKKRSLNIKEKLAFLRPWDRDDDIEADMEISDLGAGEEAPADRGPSPAAGILHDSRLWMTCILVLIFIATIGFYLYNRNHTFTTYVITSARENADVEGTQYAALGKSIIKYSPDGVFCVSRKNEMKWSSAFSMQAPITDICDDRTMVIAEQQGTQVAVFNESGMLGSFQTEYPILKAAVSGQGVTALVTQGGEVTWITLFGTGGEKIAEIRTTVEDFGYPLDVAISPSGKRLMVSFLGVKESGTGTTIAFFDFSSAAGSNEAHMTGSAEYPGQVFPEIFYADENTPAAVGDEGLIIYTNSGVPEEKDKILFDDEIVSTFHSESAVGFVFENQTDGSAGDGDRWRMALYSYTGRKMMETTFDGSYSRILLDGDEILAYTEQYLMVFTRHGTMRFNTDFEEPVRYFMKIPGFRKYMVITRNNLNEIRIR